MNRAYGHAPHTGYAFTFVRRSGRVCGDSICGAFLCTQTTGGTTLAVPMKDISLYRICAAVDPKAIDKMISVHSSPSPFCPVGRNIKAVLDQTYNTLKDDLIASMKSITMEKIVNDYHAILESDKYNFFKRTCTIPVLELKNSKYGEETI